MKNENKKLIAAAIVTLEFVADNLPESTWRHLHQINLRRAADRLRASQSFDALTEKQRDNLRVAAGLCIVAARKGKQTRNVETLVALIKAAKAPVKPAKKSA